MGYLGWMTYPEKGCGGSTLGSSSALFSDRNATFAIPDGALSVELTLACFDGACTVDNIELSAAQATAVDLRSLTGSGPGSRSSSPADAAAQPIHQVCRCAGQVAPVQPRSLLHQGSRLTLCSLGPLQAQRHEVAAVGALDLDDITLPPGEAPAELERLQIGEDVVVEEAAQPAGVVTTDDEPVTLLMTGATGSLRADDGRDDFVAYTWILGHSRFSFQGAIVLVPQLTQNPSIQIWLEAEEPLAPKPRFCLLLE